MNKTQAKNRMAALFARCWVSFVADDIGHGGPFGYIEWLEWAEEEGLLFIDPVDDEYKLVPGVELVLPPPPSICICCGGEFFTKRSTAKTCSNACSMREYRKRKKAAMTDPTENTKVPE